LRGRIRYAQNYLKALLISGGMRADVFTTGAERPGKDPDEN